MYRIMEKNSSDPGPGSSSPEEGGEAALPAYVGQKRCLAFHCGFCMCYLSQEVRMTGYACVEM